jgi:alpha-amylase
MTPEKSWILRTNVYEVNLRQYTQEGTINAFRAHLPRLRDMGVETLWFMPVTPISEEKKKGSMGSYYACSDYTGVATEFGTIEDWKALVRQARDMGFRVILDWVANHTGWDHRWTREHPEWYEQNPDGGFVPAHGMDDIIELEFRNPELRTAMIDAMRWWVTETGIDGFRCDLAFWVEAGFWIEAKAALDEVKPLFWLGELDPLTHPEYMQVFDAAYTWSWMHAAQEYYEGRGALSELHALPERYRHSSGIPAWFTTNHDENSWNGTEFEKYGPLAAALAVFSCTWPGLPLIYSGQELPNRKRLQFFEKDVIEWQGQPALHTFYKTLLEFRAQRPALAADAACRILKTSAGPAVLAFLRSAGNDEVLVLVNLTAGVQEFVIHDELKVAGFGDLFSKAKRSNEDEHWHLSPWGYAVLYLQ